MGYLELLASSAAERQSIVCFGLDPDISQLPGMPAQGSGKKIISFFSQIIDASLAEKSSISALKPNYAYFAQYGFEGLRALKSLIERYSGKLPIILDAKRGDIGKSSAAYAAEAFDFWGADALTVSPYMGHDSLSPFFGRCKQGKGAYVLCRTSNTGAADFQSLPLEGGKPLFAEVARKVCEWHGDGVGMVMGATAPSEIGAVLQPFRGAGKRLPLLVPGVGAQGASARETARALKSAWPDAFSLHRINSSSAIAYAHRKKGTGDFVGAALAEIARMNSEIGRA